MWVQVGNETKDKFAVVVGDQVMHQTDEFTSFYTFVSAHGVFSVRLDSLVEVIIDIQINMKGSL